MLNCEDKMGFAQCEFPHKMAQVVVLSPSVGTCVSSWRESGGRFRDCACVSLETESGGSV